MRSEKSLSPSQKLQATFNTTHQNHLESNVTLAIAAWEHASSKKLRENWTPFTFASLFMSNAEFKYSKIELELLAIVWSNKHLRACFLANRYQLLTDHKAIISSSNEYCGNNLYQSGLSRCSDFFFLYFDLILSPGVILGIND